MNIELIIKMIEPYLTSGTMTYREFERVFDMLSVKERQEIAEILRGHGIELIDHINNIIDIEPEDIDIFSEDVDDELNKEAQINTDFLFQDKSDHIVQRSSVRLSNEVLCKLVQEGSMQARNDLCAKNKRLVMKYAAAYYRYLGNKLDIEDLEQAGYIGLLKAAEKFDFKMNNAFTTYAVFWIKQSISRELADTGFTVRLPVHMIEHINKIRKAESSMMNLTLKERVKKIAELYGYREEDVEEYMAIGNRYLMVNSLDDTIKEDGDTALIEMVQDKESPDPYKSANESLLRVNLDEVLSTLTSREGMVLRLRFGLDDGRQRTLEEVGQYFDVTRERVRQIEAKALRKLCHPSRAKKVKDFL